MNTRFPAARHITTALAIAIALSACGDDREDASAQTRSAEAAGGQDADIPHMLRPVIVEAPSDVPDDTRIDTEPAIASTDASAPDGRTAAERYIDGRSAGAQALAEPPAPPRPATSPSPERERRVQAEAPAVARAPDRAPGSPLRAEAATREVRPAPPPRAAERVARVDPPRMEPAEPQDAPIARAPVDDGDSRSARSLNQQAIVLTNSGRAAQAIPLLERAVAMQPRDAEMLGNLGYAYMLAGQHRSARVTLLRALELSPTRSATWLNLGQTYAELGQADGAVDAVLKGYRYSSRKASVRSALQRAASGDRHSIAWRRAAGRALEQIGV